MVSRARARLTRIELDNILRCPPRKSESPQVHRAQIYVQQARELQSQTKIVGTL